MNFGFCLKPIDQQTPPFYLGFSRVDLAEVIRSQGVFHKKCPIIHESDLHVGSVKVKIELGINELHFGSQLIGKTFFLKYQLSSIDYSLESRFPDSLYNRRENVSMCSDESIVQQDQLVRLGDQVVRTKCHPGYSNQCNTDRNFENKTVQTEHSQPHQIKSLSSGDGVDDRDTEMASVNKETQIAKPKIYCGLLFIEGLRNVKDQTSAEYFITYEGFWNQCQESTEVSVEFALNYLKVNISYFYI